MSEQDAAVAPEAAETTPETAPAADPPAPDPGEEFDAARALEKIRKANAEAKQLRERAKSAEDRATNLEAQAARAAELEAQLVRERVARRMGVQDDEVVAFWKGTTEEEVLSSAEKFLTKAMEIGRPKMPAAPPTRPVESLQPGSGTPQQSGPVQMSESDLAHMTPAQIQAARVAGQLADLMAGKR